MLKKTIIILSLLLAVGAGVGYYFWRQMVALPDWYHPQKTTDDSQSIDVNAAGSKKIYRKIEEQIQQQLVNNQSSDLREKSQNPEIDIQLNQQDINQLLAVSIAENSSNYSILKAARTIHTEIKDSNLEVGAVVNTDKISDIGLTDRQRKTFEKITESFPQIKNRDIYIAIEGKPQAEGGNLVLNEGSKIKIGNLNFTLQEIAKKLGLSPQEIQQHLLLNLAGIDIRDIQLSGQELKLKISSDLDQ